MVSWFIAFLALVDHNSCAQELSLGEQPVYEVYKTSEQMLVDGRSTEEIWQKAEARSFEYFYRVDKPTDVQKGKFKMVWDDANLYVYYEFEDRYLTAREKQRDGQPYDDDCAELFIIPAADSLDSHIGFELNLYNASNDFIYFNDYFKGKNYVFKAFDPNHKSAIFFKGTINDNTDIDQGWSLELAIPLDTFRDLPHSMKIKAGSRWAFQAVRQDRNDLEGRRRSSATLFPIYDIEKGVHQANRFGLMKFVDY